MSINAPNIVPVAITSLQEAAPARKRPGRAPALDPLTGERINKPRASGTRKRPARKPSTRARGPRSLRPELVAMLSLINSIVIVSPLGTRPMEAMTDPAIMPSRVGDELDIAEINALAAGLDAQCQRSPRFRKIVEGFLAAGSGGALITTVAMIGTRRAARHGLVPAHLDPMLGMLMAGEGMEALNGMAPPAPDTTPDPVTHETAPRIDFDTIDDGGEPLGMEP